MRYLLLIVALVLNASANILMKIGAEKLGTIRGLSFYQLAFRFGTNYTLILSMTIFALSAVVYVLALTKVNISIAYPLITSGSLLIISLFSFFYLKESITLSHILGVILVITGMTLIAYNLK